MLELSVVLVIIGLITAGGVSIGMAQIEQAKTTQTIEKMNAIEQALLTFRRLNNRLPCPNISAGVGITSGAPYGREDDSSVGSGSCAGNLISSDVALGALPIKALNLPTGFMLDGWGNKFTYAVTIRFTATNAFTTYPINSAGSIVLRNKEDSYSISEEVIYVLVSHGKNGSGVYKDTGAFVAGNSTNAGEQENADGPGGDKAFRTGEFRGGESGASNYFDDIVRYKLRMNLSGLNE